MSEPLHALEVDDLLSQLKSTPKDFIVSRDNNSSSKDLPPVSCEPIPEEELGDYVISQTQVLVKETMSAFTQIKQQAVATNDPEIISALGDLIKSVSGALDGLNKIHIQNKKHKSAKEIAHINAEARRKQLDEPPVHHSILAVGTREEILKLLEDPSKTKDKSKIIDAEVTNVDNKVS